MKSSRRGSKKTGSDSFGQHRSDCDGQADRAATEFECMVRDVVVDVLVTHTGGVPLKMRKERCPPS